MIATNIEQSKRLVEAGLKPESADQCYVEDYSGKWSDYSYHYFHDEDEKELSLLPAWSLSALWDIMKTSGVVYDYGTYESSDKVMESLVEAVCRLAKQGRVKYE